MKTIEDALKPLKDTDRVKILMPNGVFMQGRKRKILRDLKYSDYEYKVTETTIQFVPIPFRRQLVREFVVTVDWASDSLLKCKTCPERSCCNIAN